VPNLAPLRDDRHVRSVRLCATPAYRRFDSARDCELGVTGAACTAHKQVTVWPLRGQVVQRPVRGEPEVIQLAYVPLKIDLFRLEKAQHEELRCEGSTAGPTGWRYRYPASPRAGSAPDA
jgi:hypothetical protein